MGFSAQEMTIEQAIESTGKCVCPTFGVSMQPMLKQGRDSVVIVKKTERLDVGDVALYKREDTLVLHRVIAVFEGGYVMRGDNTTASETVLEDDVIGVLTEFFQGDKHISVYDKNYLKYVKKRLKNHKIRVFFERIRERLGLIKNSLFKGKK